MIKKPLFISFDGPKGTGKSSLIQAVSDRLNREFSIERLVEKEIDPLREESKYLLKNYKNKMNKAVEARLLELLSKGRHQIGQRYISKSNADIILMDRWFPSDAVFRIFHTFEECLSFTKKHQVIQPDIIIATVCNPEISLHRARTRPDGLRSLVIDNLQEHTESTIRFEAAALKQNWFLLHTEGELSALADKIVERINTKLQLKMI